MCEWKYMYPRMPDALAKSRVLRRQNSNLVRTCDVIFEQNGDDFLLSSLYLSVFSECFTSSVCNFYSHHTIK